MTLPKYLVLVACLLISAAHAGEADAATALAAAKRGGDYLVRTVQDDGTFIYKYSAETASRSNYYNWLRHAGTVAALCQLHEATSDPRYLAAADATAARLAQAVLPVNVDGTTHYAVISDPAFTSPGRRGPAIVKAGGNALAIFALDSVDRAHGGKTDYGPLIEKLATYLLATRDPGGTPLSKYLVEDGRFDTWKSSYYPGQCLLAFAIMQERAPSPIWSDAMHRLAATKLKDLTSELRNPMHQPQPDDPPRAGFDHWTLIGMARALPLLDPVRLSEGDDIVTREHILQVLVAYGDQEVREQIATGEDWQVGTFGINPGGGTSTAIRLEGLHAIRGAVRTAHETHPSPTIARHLQRIDAWDTAIARSRAFLIRCQYTAPTKGTLDVTGGQRNQAAVTHPRHGIIQIDYVQHAISAWLSPY